MFFSKKLFFILVLLVAVILPFSELAAQEIDALNPFIRGDTTVIIANIIKLILGLVGVLALIFMIYGGVTLMTSSGNAEQVKKGKGALIWATLGLVVCFLAYSLVTFVITKTMGLGSATPTGGGAGGSCAEGLTLCAGACVDTATNPNHCGGCGAACAGGQTCQGGTCRQ